ncbi:probable glucan endo-1,3-beta-glucosidase A6 [Selaginella moellendorffii]|uniref:probable glucan endo-1,3-beta-glucosidase A6 n=1 Tax=Selaginella moellendorffii TaxID=88036 RepID=UPI000D1CCA14|nr:probable glucan endo-1,3-beta-glucosidase A6 [Selaginella moellendorffii]|eukprot:XP_024533798.1 probable glucan endo-1,3-beta-glucosidase A6 [Selaginella moellendorffii]
MATALLLLLLLLGPSEAIPVHNHRYHYYPIGVNYGQLGNNLPVPLKSVELIRQLKLGRVKIYDANPSILSALANTSVKVTVMVPNQQIPSVASSQSFADEWVKSNVTAYYPFTRIRTVLIGNEILSDFSIRQSTWPKLVPAMKNIHRSLAKLGLHRKIKVSTPHALLNVLQGYVFPPSNGTFRDDIAEPIIRPMLEFLHSTNSPFFVDAYPFFTWEFNRATVPINFALFNGSGTPYRDPGNGLVYDNLLDIQLDSITAAMAKLGHESVKLGLAETGWPTKGGIDERGANFYNAALYNRRLAKKLATKPPLGTPKRPHQQIPAFIFALFNENLKPGPVTERNWGLFAIADNGSTAIQKYEIDLTGRLSDGDYKPMALPPPEPLPGTAKIWCVANQSASTSQLQGGIDFACGPGGVNCSLITDPGQPCFLPNTTISHASIVFNAYYFLQRTNGGSCVFNGAAFLTSSDPSYASCEYAPTII